MLFKKPKPHWAGPTTERLLLFVVVINVALIVAAEVLANYSGTSLIGKDFFTYLLAPVGQFDDFYGGLPNSSPASLTSLNGYVFPPISAIFYGSLALLPTTPFDLRLFVFQLISILLFLAAIRVWTGIKESATLALFTYPVLFCFFRGNNELIQVSIFFISLKAFEKRRETAGTITATINQLLEFSPLLFLISKPWHRRRFVLVAQTSVISIMMLWLFRPDVNLLDYVNNLYQYLSAHSNPDKIWILYNNSIWNLFSYLDYLLFRLGLPEILVPNSSMVGVGLLGISTALLVLVLQRGNLIDQMITGISLWLLVPAYSFDYRLTYLVIPLLLVSKDLTSYTRRIQALLLILLVSPKHLLHIPSTMAWPVGGTENGILNPLLLIILILITSGSVTKNCFTHSSRGVAESWDLPQK